MGDVSEQPIELRTDDGLALEGVVDAPSRPRACLVLCHPHPKMGGTMNAPLLLALRDGLVERDWAVLRFNFRGIGRSEGEASDGIAEVADARAALATARKGWPDLPIAIGGWSFGAAVAVRAAAEDRSLAACIGIAPAIHEKPGVTAGLPPPSEVDLVAPLHFVVGANDDLVLPDDVQGWGREMGAATTRMAGANHFFWGRYEALVEEVLRFLDEQVG